MNVRVVNISLNVAPHEELAAADRAGCGEAGVVTVAPTGNRPRNDPGDSGSALVPEEEFGTFQPGENARDVVHPAAYEHVLAVNASMAAPAAPTRTSTSWRTPPPTSPRPRPTASPTRSTAAPACSASPATSWAAAEVSGALALGFAHFPDDTPAMAVTRLLLTADGRPDIPNRLSGAGDVQPYDALTRPLAMDEDGGPEQTVPQPDTQVYAAPEPEPDVLAATRRNAVWWGLLGGGALLLALVLRPVLARRSPP